MAAVLSGAANSRLGGSGKTTNVAAPKSSATSTFNTVTDSVNNESQDQIMRAQIEWWKTHTANGPEQVQQKTAAYQYAVDHGIKGAVYPNETEFKTDPSFKEQTNWAGLAPVAAGAGLGALAGGPVGALIGGGVGIVGGGVASTVAKANNNASTFEAGQSNAANPVLPGSPELATPGGGTAGGSASLAGYPGAAGGGGAPGAVGGTAGGGMTPQQISQLTGATLAQVTDPTSGPLYAALANSIQQRNQNQGYVTNNYMPAMATANTDINTAIQNGNNAVTNQYGIAQNVANGYQALQGQQSGYVEQANATGAQNLAGYGQALGAASGMQAGSYNQLAGTYGGMSQLSATPQSSNVQAALAGTNLASAQNAALTTAGYTGAGYQGYQAQGYDPQQAQYELANTNQADYQKAAMENAWLTRADANQSQLTSAGYDTASSDPNDVAAERAALGQLTGMAGGSLDTVNGAGAGGGLAAQQDALAQYGALTSPQATAKEKFLYEQQREAQEQQEAASRAALMNDYRARGVGGSGMELASILQSGQQNSQQRLLGDLGTQAGAVDRSMQALAGYGNLSSQMVAQGNQVNQANMANRLGAAGAQGSLASNIRGQGDTLAMYNTGQYNQNQLANAQMANQNNQFNANALNSTSMFNAGAANQLSQFNAGQFNQNQQFNANAYNSNSQFNTGQANMVGVANMNAYNQANQFNANAVNQGNMFAADAGNTASQFNANAYNQNSQFNANAYNTNQNVNAGYANQNAQFNANAFNNVSQFNTGQSNAQNQFNANAVNNTNQFNTSQNMVQGRFSDQFAADQQNDAAARAQNLANTGITVGQNYATNAGSLNTAAAAANTAAYDRNTQLTKLGENGLTATANAGTTANNAAMQQSGNQVSAAGQKFGNTLAVGSAFMGSGTQGTTAINTGLQTIAGDNAAKQAQALASKQGFNLLDPGTW